MPRLRYSVTKLIQKILGDRGVMFLFSSSREAFETRDLDYLETRNAKLSRSWEITTSEDWNVASLVNVYVIVIVDVRSHRSIRACLRLRKSMSVSGICT